MNEKERIQVQKERAMAGLDLRNELQSPHVEEETFDLEKLLGDLKGWTQEEDGVNETQVEMISRKALSTFSTCRRNFRT